MPRRLSQHPRLPHAAGAAGALMIAFSPVLVRFADVAPVTAAVFRCLYALPFLAALSLRERSRFGARAWRNRVPALVAGVFFAADLILWHHAIRYIGAGLATVLGNAQIVLVGLVAWVALRERPRAAVLAAVPVVLGGGVLISGVLGAGAYGADPLLGAVFGLSTAFAYSGFILLLRHSNSDVRRPAGPLCDATGIALVVAAAAGTVLGDLDLAPAWPAHGWLALLAVNSQVVGWLLISVSLPRLPALVTSILLMLQPVGSVLLGMWLLAEAPSPVQLGGVAVVIAGVLLASAPGRRQSEAAGSSPRSSPDVSASGSASSSAGSAAPSSELS